MKRNLESLTEQSGITYENLDDKKLVEAMMLNKVGNLEWICAHWLYDMDEETKKEYLKALKDNNKWHEYKLK